LLLERGKGRSLISAAVIRNSIDAIVDPHRPTTPPGLSVLLYKPIALSINCKFSNSGAGIDDGAVVPRDLSTEEELSRLPARPPPRSPLREPGRKQSPPRARSIRIHRVRRPTVPAAGGGGGSSSGPSRVAIPRACARRRSGMPISDENIPDRPRSRAAARHQHGESRAGIHADIPISLPCRLFIYLSFFARGTKSVCAA